MAQSDPNTIPLLRPPQGIESNFIDPVSRGHELVIVIVTCLSLMILSVFLRLYSKAVVTRSLGWDDYTCVLGAIGAITCAAFGASLLHYGYGLHLWDVSEAKYGPNGSKYLLVVEVLSGPTMALIKVSIFLLYLRVFSTNLPTRLAIYMGIFSVVVYNAVCSALVLVFCIPRHNEAWVELFSIYRCFRNEQNVLIASGALNLITDIYVLCLPLPIVWSLQLPLRKRLGLIAIFMTGLIACVSSVATLILRIISNRNIDYTWYSIPVVYTGLLEQNAGIICSCMLACAALYRQPVRNHIRFPSAGSFKSWLSKSYRSSTTKSSLDAQETSFCDPKPQKAFTPRDPAFFPAATELKSYRSLDNSYFELGNVSRDVIACRSL